MFCTKCGKELPEGTKFCTSCGEKLVDFGVPKPPPRTTQAPWIVLAIVGGILLFIIVIIFIGILAAIAIPKYIDLQDQANEAGRDGSAAAVRAAVALYYAEGAVAGEAQFPSRITGDMFSDGELPPTSFGGYTWSYDPRTGTVTTN